MTVNTARSYRQPHLNPDSAVCWSELSPQRKRAVIVVQCCLITNIIKLPTKCTHSKSRHTLLILNSSPTLVFLSFSSSSCSSTTYRANLSIRPSLSHSRVELICLPGINHPNVARAALVISRLSNKQQHHHDSTLFTSSVTSQTQVQVGDKEEKKGQTVVMTAPGGIEIQTNNGARHERKVQSCRLVIKLLIEQFE